MEKNKKINDWLHLCGVGSIDKLTDEQCCYLYDELYPQRNGESVTFCYKDRSTDGEREDFAKNVRKCLKSELRITVHRLSNEGVIFDEKDDKHFQHKFDYAIE